MAGATHLLGQAVGRYRIESVIGSGGFATVYRAVDTALERPVALKVVDPAAHRNPTIARRFVLEGQAVASLDHPAIVPVYDAGEHDGVLWLAMRLIPGSSLDHAMGSGRRFAPEETMAVIDRIGAALDHAHAHGIVHRDVKPSNILLEHNEPGRAWLTDFGIATTARTAGLYTTGALGTAAYMAPEQSRPSQVGPPADLYSLGCVAFEMLTGQRPYPGDDYVSLLMAHATAAVPPTGRPGLDQVIGRSLAKQPADRPPSGALLARELRAALAAEPTALAPTSPVPLRVAAAGAVPTVVDERNRSRMLVPPTAPPAVGSPAVGSPAVGSPAVGSPALAPPPAAVPPPLAVPPVAVPPVAPVPAPAPVAPYQPPAAPYHPPVAPHHPPVAPHHPPVAPPAAFPAPRVVGPPTPLPLAPGRRRGRGGRLVGLSLLIVLLSGGAAAAALIELDRDGGVQHVTDDAGLKYEVPSGWSAATDPPTVIWSKDGAEMARLTHAATSQSDAGNALRNREPAVCPVVASSFEVVGADDGARCDASDGPTVAAVAALVDGELWIVTVEDAVPEDQREDFLASLDFS